jgi:hypothetical protein
LVLLEEWTETLLILILDLFFVWSVFFVLLFAFIKVRELESNGVYMIILNSIVKVVQIIAFGICIASLLKYLFSIKKQPSCDKCSHLERKNKFGSFSYKYYCDVVGGFDKAPKYCKYCKINSCENSSSFKQINNCSNCKYSIALNLKNDGTICSLDRYFHQENHICEYWDQE